jgi:hypothetical protein
MSFLFELRSLLLLVFLNFLLFSCGLQIFSGSRFFLGFLLLFIYLFLIFNRCQQRWYLVLAEIRYCVRLLLVWTFGFGLASFAADAGRVFFVCIYLPQLFLFFLVLFKYFCLLLSLFSLVLLPLLPKLCQLFLDRLKHFYKHAPEVYSYHRSNHADINPAKGGSHMDIINKVSEQKHKVRRH